MGNQKGSGDEPQGPVALSGRTVAGRYRIVGTVGQGGIGKVYEAEQIGLDRMVAVKCIRPERRTDEVTTKRFLREARAAGRITSPHVVTLFDCGTDLDTGELYIAMEMLHGQSLLERLAQTENLPLVEVLRTATQIARGLRAAHEAGVLHRDLKPANVFLCEDGTVKVLDFGIAKILDDERERGEALTKVNRILGTPVYMSPEAATRQPLGPTTDLYALGLLIYEMVVGAPPFKTGDAWKTLEAHVKTTPPRLSQAAPWLPIPEALDALVAQLLRKKPQERPRDAGEVATRLDRLATTLALAESSSDRTMVELMIPDAPADTESAWSTGDLEAKPSLADDDPNEKTEVWQGGQAPAPVGPPAHQVGRPFPREELEAYQRQLDAQRRTEGPGIYVTRRQMVLAAVVFGLLTFLVIVVLRLTL